MIVSEKFTEMKMVARCETGSANIWADSSGLGANQNRELRKLLKDTT